MKTFRILGAVFCVFGCFFALLGILTSILPMIENEQFKLIVNSFQETSADPLTNTLNAIVVFCLHSGYFLLFCGISLTVAGGLISASAHKRQKALKDESSPKAATVKASDNSGVPKPAYFPGGLAPPSASLISDQEEPVVQIVNTMTPQKSTPISGSIEPAFTSDESDAHKLMLNDEQLTTKTPPSAPDYSQYLSNSASSKADKKEAKAVLVQVPRRPRIVSTMGKNRP